MALVPGTYSQVGRTSETADLLHLREVCEVTDIFEDPPVEGAPVRKAEQSRSANSAAKKSPKKRRAPPRTPATAEEPPPPGNQGPGELARAILEHVSSGSAAGGDTAARASDDRAAADGAHAPRPPSAMVGTSTFAAVGMDGIFTNRFAAAKDTLGVGRASAERPEPGWYTVKHDQVLFRQPRWELGRAREREKERAALAAAKAEQSFGSTVSPRSASEGASPGTGAFLTDLDLEALDDLDLSSLTARQRSSLGLSLKKSPPREKNGLMAAASERNPLGKVGRVHVLANEVTEPAADLLEQDIKGYHHIRYPQWDFGRPEGRKPLLKSDAMSPPGKYDINWSSVRAPEKGMPFSKAVPRTVSVRNLGHSAPPAAVHPEEHRSPGACVMDRSRAKDVVRKRITHVNDFAKELARPPLPAASHEYHDKDDPEACASVLTWELTYDRDMADLPTTCRRDLGHVSYATMMPRGRDAVQGNRALSGDTGVRGSVGLGFTETTGQLSQPIERLEARESVKFRFSTPQFHKYSTFQQLTNKNNFNHGYAPVEYPVDTRKIGKLRKVRGSQSVTTFSREDAAPGYMIRSKFGGTKVSRQSRTHEALPGWDAGGFGFEVAGETQSPKGDAA